MNSRKTLLNIRDLKMHFPIKKGMILKRRVGIVKAVDGLNFSIKQGETLGLVGESGCGKSTTGLSILQLHRPTEGEVIFENKNLCNIHGPALRRIRREMQMIFQDPYASLNPRMSIGSIIAEPMVIHRLSRGKAKRTRVKSLLNEVGLDPKFADRYPHEFSGGQRQRIGIARALAVEPKFLVCDEPVSALDVSIQAQIINLLDELQKKHSLTYLFIAHDLSVVRHISDRVAVMYVGKMVELAGRDELYRNPLHPYTKALLSSVPIPNPIVEANRERIKLSGDVASPINPPPYCRFLTRCQLSTAICKETEPEFQDAGNGHFVACHQIQLH